MSRHIGLLAHIPEHVKIALADAGFTRSADLQVLTPPQRAQVAKDLGLSQDVLESVCAPPPSPGKRSNGQAASSQGTDGAATQLCLPIGESALALLEQEEAQAQYIPTFAQAVDELLGGGIRCGAVTEVCGLPGAGKTQMCSQLAVAARLPVSFGGVEGATLYIDTEGSFIPARLRDMAAGAAAHVVTLANQQTAQANPQAAAMFDEVTAEYTVANIMQGVFVHRVHDAAELMAVVLSLPSLLASPRYASVRLVIVDSVAFPLRSMAGGSSADGAPGEGAYGGRGGGSATWEAHVRRTRLAMAISRRLHDLAESSRVAVVVTNHMTTTVGGSGGSTNYTSSLGDEWSHAIARRVLLTARPRAQLQTGAVDHDAPLVREAFLLRAPDNTACSFGERVPSAQFKIDEHGIRDIM